MSRQSILYIDSYMHTRMHLIGISEVMERNIGVFRQQGHVELEVYHLVKEILRTGIICESWEQ
jgi:hypothetical protein